MKPMSDDEILKICEERLQDRDDPSKWVDGFEYMEKLEAEFAERRKQLKKRKKAKLNAKLQTAATR